MTNPIVKVRKPRKSLPEVAPCPCGKDCETAVAPWCNELWYVVSQCGFSGPQRSSERAAILAWNRRAPGGDAERRGGREILKELQVHANEMFDASMADKSNEWAEACAYFEQWAWLRLKTGKFGKRGEVLPATKKARKRT